MTDTNEFIRERREHHLVRQVFDQACILIAPYVASNDKVKTISDFAIAHMLHDRFPDLSNEEVYLIITTVEKAHKEERLQNIMAAVKG